MTTSGQKQLKPLDIDYQKEHQHGSHKDPRKVSTSEAIRIFIAKQGRPVLATDIVTEFSDKNKTTIYRQLQKMEDEGLVSSFISGVEGKGYYELVSDHNCHFECMKCGKVICVHIHVDTNTVKGNVTHIQLKGVCEKCSL